jgi:hypothetical protein
LFEASESSSTDAAQAICAWRVRRADRFLERGPTLADATISDALTAFDAEAWNKALARRESDRAGAFTAARTLLESVCKHLLEDGDGTPLFGATHDLSKLYRQVSERMNSAPSQHSEDAFTRFIGSAASIVEGLGTLRNRIGDGPQAGQADSTSCRLGGEHGRQHGAVPDRDGQCAGSRMIMKSPRAA